MIPAFEDVFSQMEPLFQKFVDAPKVSFVNRTEFPKSPGLYLLSEGSENLYVGRSGSGLKKRLRGHTAGTHFSSSFAFLLARDETGIKASYKKEGSRAALMTHLVFRPAFDRAVERVAKMNVQFIELNDDYQQYLLELFTALRLKTRHNHFKTS